ncbi:MAG: ATP-dependent DNA helicase [Oscillospiraceae bacterium]|nr:ATP-dependent DNA helicase [Oscillospiraceae bacterium]
MEKHISVRDLVEFVARSGSIDSRFTGRNRLEEGARVHRKLQKEEGYQAEVRLSHTETVSGISFTVGGRADGIIISAEGVVLDEIKSTLTPLELITEGYSPTHWAQAKVYGYIYCAQNSLERISVRLTYYEMNEGAIKRFTREYGASELCAFFTELLEKYAVWMHYSTSWKEASSKTMKELAFPFDEYREGQRKLAVAVYRTIVNEGRLFAMAPTGIGKTISTLFPAIKAMGEGYGEKIFYLTAKTVTRQAAQAALDQMRERGLRVKSVVITAKDKVCFLEERACKPEYCEYANGHFDRVNGAVMDVLENLDSIDAENIAEYAQRHRVCPFELALDLTLWCDVVICDYNYLFDPQVSLKRFFSEGGDYVFLVDEAHNLADRAREMYSAGISKRNLLALKKTLGLKAGTGRKRKKTAAEAPGGQEAEAGRRGKKGEYEGLRETLVNINKLLLDMKRECGDAAFAVRKDAPGELKELLELFSYQFSEWLSKNPEPDQAALETYFDVLSYLAVAELYDENYSTMMESGYGGEFTVKLFCADPAGLLSGRFALGRSGVLFSATLTPGRYFIDVLGGDGDSNYLTLPSPFPTENLLVLVADNISTKYKDRDGSYENIADLIHVAASGKAGKYIAYFPSYSYLSNVYAVFCEKYPKVSTARQSPGMTEGERSEFLALFEDDGCAESEAFVAFCVLGGVFSEGVDLAGDKLIGAIITGVGLPQVNRELDVVRDQYGGPGRGYDFAYRYPGMNKVLQAAGRVIRSESDRGVVLLIDERFSSRSYRTLFPPHWNDSRVVRDTRELAEALGGFWGSQP